MNLLAILIGIDADQGLYTFQVTGQGKVVVNTEAQKPQDWDKHVGRSPRLGQRFQVEYAAFSGRVLQITGHFD